MQSALLLFLLLFTPQYTWAASPGGPSAVQEDDAPLTVLEHTLSVRSADGATVVTQTWSVRVENAAALAAGFTAPIGMGGARSGKALIVDTVASFPSDVASGDRFRFVHTQTLGKYASGTFHTVEDVALERARADFRVAGGTLNVWTDAGAQVDLGTTGGRVDWGGDGGDLVWSTWPSWEVAAQRSNADIESRLVGQIELGRELAEGVAGLSPSGVIQRVNTLVRTIPETGSWSTARPVWDIVRTREANYTERALLILNMLRVGRKDAIPALLATDIPSPGPPNALVAPHLFTQPAVAIMQEDGPPILIDPMSPDVSPPDVPSRLQGGRLWAIGTPPYDLSERGVFTGRAVLSGQYVIASDGSAHWNMTLSADGRAAEVFRERFGEGVSVEDRDAVLKRLASVAVPDLMRFSVSASGLGKLTKPVRIEMTGYTANAMARLGPGLTGDLHPLMAPALAGWLPGRIEVIEQLAVRRPTNMLPLAIQRTQNAHAPDMLVASSMRVEGERILIDTRVVRPDTAGRPTAEARATRILEERAREGAKLHMFPWPTTEVRAALHDGESDLTPLERSVIEALAWWRDAEERRARRALRAALANGSVADVAAAYVRFGEPKNHLPWEALLEEASPPDRMICARAMEAQGRSDLAWRKAMALSSNPSAEVRLDAMLVMARTQPTERPSLEDDREGHLAWREPVVLLEEVQSLAKEMVRPEAREEALTALATLQLQAGDLFAAETALDERLTLGSSPRLVALRAEIRARQGASPVEVARILRHAGVLDDAGAYHAARALAIAGDSNSALGWTLVAARLQPDDPERWDFVVDAALAAGDLERALEGAQRASDAAPADRARASRHSHLASLAWDREQAQVAARRAGAKATDIPWAETIAKLADLAAPEERWAALRYHDGKTNQDPYALLARGHAALAAGAAASAARDGEMLLYLHDDPRGAALFFAATVGTVYGTSPARVLDDAVEKDPEARRARFEYRLLTGGNMLEDLEELPDSEATEALRTFAKTGAVSGWIEATDPALSASGFVSLGSLGKARGVAAVGHRSKALAIIRHRGEAWLPPPLSLLYEPRARAVAISERDHPVYALDGGVIPVFAAVATEDDTHTLGLGFTPSAAIRALDSAL